MNEKKNNEKLITFIHSHCIPIYFQLLYQFRIISYGFSSKKMPGHGEK